MSGALRVVPPRSGRRETLALAGIAAAILLVCAGLVQARKVDNYEPRLFGWQISSFYDLNPTDQAIYNGLVTAGEELWWIHGGRLAYPELGKEAWPTAEELDEEYELPPFVKDLAWQQHGKVSWRRAAEFSCDANADARCRLDGATVYYGGGGQVPGQSAYLLVLSHIHKGASYWDGSTMWVHPDPNAPVPTTIKTDSLIVNGWKEIIPYLGSNEVERLRGARR